MVTLDRMVREDPWEEITYSQQNRKWEGARTSLSDSMGKPQSLMLLGLTHSISELLAVISCKK